MAREDEWFTWRVVTELRRREPEVWQRIVANARNLALRSSVEVEVPDNLAVIHLDKLETDANGMKKRRYFREGLGFGYVQERPLNEKDLGQVWVYFPDEMGMGLNMNPEVIENDTELTSLINFATNFLLPRDVDIEATSVIN